MANPTLDISRFRIYDIMLPAIDGSHIKRGQTFGIVVSNAAANRFSPVLTVVPISPINKNNLPTHAELHIHNNETFLGTWYAEAESVMPVDRARIKKCVGFIDWGPDKVAIEKALSKHLGLSR